MKRTDSAGPFLLCVLLVSSILLFYTAYDKNESAIVIDNLVKVVLFTDVPYSLSELNKVSALAGIGLASIWLAIRPLAETFPGTFGRFLGWRLFLGMAGLVFMAAHSVYAIFITYRLSLVRMFFENDRVWGIAAAFPALFIFLAVAILSRPGMIHKLKTEQIYLLDRLCYSALGLAVLHFILLETRAGVFAVRPFGKVFLALPFLVILMKVISVGISKWKRTHPY